MPKKHPPKARADEPDDDDESINSDEAFDSDDDRRYGSFFEDRDKAQAKGDGDDDDSESEAEDDQDEDESESEDNDSAEDGDDSEDEAEDESNDDDNDDESGDGQDYMLSLLDKLDGDSKDQRQQESAATGIAVHTKESEFSASVVRKADLTLDSLMGSIQDTSGYGAVQKQLKRVAQGSATPVPVARVISDRIQRKINYEAQCKDVSQWIDAVQQNRQAETLDFRPKQRLEVTQQGLVDSFTPTTEFEKQIHAALQKAGQEDEETIIQREHDQLKDDLGSNEITLEEYKKRRGDLAKMRALMFYHEQKRHHINKIKSKKYRRIRKRQRERAEEADYDPDAAEDADLLKEKEEVERIRERASLAHKNTSKWAKRVLKRGNKVDTNTRKALSESIRRGDDLLKKMKNTRAGEESSDSESEDLVASAHAVLADTDGASATDTPGKGVFAMAFMKKGLELQKARAREEARQLLKELEADGNDGDGVQESREDAVTAKKVRMASKEEMKGVLRDSEMVVASLQFGKEHQVSVSGNIEIDLSESSAGEAKVEGVTEKPSSRSEHISTMDPTQFTLDQASRGSPSTKARGQGMSPLNKGRISGGETPDDLNPWLSEKASQPSKGKKLRTSRGLVDVAGAGDLLEPALFKSKVSFGAPSPVGDNTTRKTITSLSQDELVRRAFASAADDEMEEFANEKVKRTEEEDPTKKLKKDLKVTVAKGWGSWTGDGAPAPMPPRKLPKKLQAPESKLGKRLRADDKKPNVIISEKRLKKLANNFMLAAVPYPYTSREEYERAMSGSLGKDFNVTGTFKDMTRPAIMTRPGKVIQPMSNKVKVQRTAAKF